MLRCTQEQKGIWLDLFCYCHQQMNGGVIMSCQDWPDAMWLRVAGSTGSSVAQDTPLWHWVGTGLVVHHYNVDAENDYKRKQKLGRVYAERRWGAQKAQKIIKMESKAYGKPQKDNPA